jgi:hypothetical protein
MAKWNSSVYHKGLEPKLHDLALSMAENKTLNLKDITLLKHLQDTMLLISISIFCVGSSSSVTLWLETGSGMAKLSIFIRNLQKSMSLYKQFSWAPLLNQNENDT